MSAVRAPVEDRAPVMSDASGIVIAPSVTEKAMRLAESGTYVFRVADGATKRTIARAINRMYGVHVESVHVLNVRWKKVSVGRRVGRSRGSRKAMVLVRKGETIRI